MLEGDKIKVAQGENPCYLLLNQANRHGLIAGASGTGKTVTMKVLAEGFAQAGVPVFMADVKGDVTGMAQPGDDTEKVRERAATLGADGWEPRGCDVRLWDMLGGDGVPVRITISDMGPDLLARLLGLTDVQRGVLAIAFRMADDNGMLLIDLKDLRAMLGYLSEHASEVEALYGRVSSQSVGAIQRVLLTLEDAGGDIFFGEPALDITDWLVTDDAGQGTVNILSAAKLMASPQVYAMFLLWMLSEIYELLPEAGDLPKPKLVFFFDEAHLLFDDMPKELTDKIVQTVKLIRSKGVGVYFVSQSPADIPDEVLAQLSNRIQHGLRAYTPAEQKAEPGLRARCGSLPLRRNLRDFRERPAFDSAEALRSWVPARHSESLLSQNEDGQPCAEQKGGSGTGARCANEGGRSAAWPLPMRRRWRRSAWPKRIWWRSTARPSIARVPTRSLPPRRAPLPRPTRWLPSAPSWKRSAPNSRSRRPPRPTGPQKPQPRKKSALPRPPKGRLSVPKKQPRRKPSAPPEPPRNSASRP